MPERLIYVSRLVRLPLLDVDGAEVGRMVDVVLGGAPTNEPPPVNGFVVEVQRRRVFISGGRVAELQVEGARLRQGTINLRGFHLRTGEQLVMGQIVNRQLHGERVIDLSIRAAAGSYSWQVATIALGGTGVFGRRRSQRVVDWSEVPELFADARPLARQAADISLLHPAEMAETIRKLPLERRRIFAEALEDERLADLLEELPESEQVRIVEGLNLERAARVLDEMEADDAADLLGEMPSQRRDQLLGAMTPDEADPVRRLLTYGADTAGGIMTPEPVIMPPSATVAQALARIRDPDISPALAAQVFVAALPNETPTGRYLGPVGYQRLLREVPSKPLIRCLDEQPEAIPVETPERDVAARVAAFDIVAVPVVDAGGRLVGAVTVDDVLDRVLARTWRGR